MATMKSRNQNAIKRSRVPDASSSRDVVLLAAFYAIVVSAAGWLTCRRACALEHHTSEADACRTRASASPKAMHAHLAA